MAELTGNPPGLTSRPATLVELLRARAACQPDKTAYTFISDDGYGESSVSYAELDRQARAIAAWLQSFGAQGERALLLYPPGLEFIAAYFGCLYAGVVAVPSYPPRLNRPSPRLQGIVNDAQARFALTTNTILANLQQRFEHAPDLAALRWLATENVPAGIESAWRQPGVTAATLAFLQYTSGSTSTPKGVMVSHANLIHNLEAIRQGFQIVPPGIGVFWLPTYHDMGLIGGVLEPMWVNGPPALMSPASFLQRPIRWLEAITRFHGTITGAPNFAYDLCVERTTPEQRATLDLSSLATVFCGAEPIRRETLERFAETFQPYGFRRETFYPCYGLAEATLLATGGAGAAAPKYYTIRRADLAQHRAAPSTGGEGSQTLVSCGHAQLGQRLVVVDPDSLNPCEPGQIGEIWLSGGSVAAGYWNRPDETRRTFQARLASGEGPFLRSGDLGFLREGELYVTGRMKDVIIIHGRNHYPQDIELTVEQCHPALAPSGGAAFAVEADGGEQLVIAHELTRQARSASVDEVLSAIRRALAEHHDLAVHAILLLKPLSIPKTSSGKIQRFACRDQFLSGTLDIIGEWRMSGAGRVASDATVFPSPATRHPSPIIRHSPLPSRRAAEIEDWLKTRLARALNVETQEIDTQQPFAYYGINSVQAVGLVADLEQWLGVSVPPTLAYDHPTISSLAHFLADGNGRAETAEHASSLPARPAPTNEPIAIIGVGCRFPGADGPEAYWRLLRDGVDAIGEVPPDRWDAEALYDPDPAAPGKMNTRWGGFLDQVDGFDAPFFRISPREAARMDPQQRLLLEVAWQALEDAGQVAERLAGSQTGVFVGISTYDHGQLQVNPHSINDPYGGAGSALSIAANRMSYLFDLRGPSLAVDTACSSSLVATYLACRSLWNGEADLALAGGVNLILSPVITVNFTKAGLMSPDGRCKPFDARANGYVRGEGAGVVVLKPLSRALADGDPIYAVIRGGAVNHDGRTNGLMAPSGPAQEAVLRQAYRSAGVSPGQVAYVETHGTGTFLGDPIEAHSLGAVLKAGRPPEFPCAIGSVKSNFGHLEAAAGIAGLIKVALSLKHRAIPPSLHFAEPNPHIPFDQLGLRVQQNFGAWPAGARRALAGVSSFGFGGTNAHVVLEAAPDAPEVPRPPGETPRAFGARSSTSATISDTPHLLALSAHNAEGLQALARGYLEFLSQSASALDDVCYTAATRRSHHEHRLALTGRTREDFADGLRLFLNGEAHAARGVSSGRRAPGRRAKVVFVFPGQGSQWHGMGRSLLETEPVFRSAIEACQRAIRRYADWSLLDQLTADEARSRLAEIDVVQPVLFALQVGLAALWRSWGIEPDAVVGHSMGEVAATHVAGALSLEEAARVICRRSQLLKRRSGQGAMASVELSLAQARAALAGYEDRLSIAVSNSPSSTVLSGDPAALSAVVETLQRRAVLCRWVKVDVASHSPAMDSLRPSLLEALGGLRSQPPSLPVYSTVTGGESDGIVFDAVYWARNLREPVLFATTVRQLLEGGYDTFVEMSAHPILLSAIQQTAHEAGRSATLVSSLRREEDERVALLESLGTLYAAGHSIEWHGLYPGGGRHVRLPAYPWRRDRYPLDSFAFAFDPRWSSGEQNSSALPANWAEWLYEVEWQPQPREAQSESASAGSWLIFADEGGVGKTLADLLSANGEQCVIVSSGDRYQRMGDGRFRLRPGHADDVQRLIADTVGAGERTWRGVVHLWALDAPDSDGTTLAALAEAQQRACLTTLRLVQAVARTPGGERPGLWLVTRGAQAIGNSSKTSSVAQSPVWGLGRVIAQEHAALWGGLVDLDPAAAPDVSAAALWDEIRAPQGEDQLAFRGGQRYVARLARKPLTHARAPGPRFRADGSYLVTGGLGDLGLAAARWMVERGARRLILLARTQLPPRSQWREAESGSRLAGQVAAIRELEALGASIHAHSVDVADEAQLAEFLAEFEAEGWPPIRGVIHAAGLVHLGPLFEMDAEAFSEDWRPKVAGSWNLHRLLENAPLDFFVMFSSMATILSSPLLGSYASANAFLDGLAQYRASRGQPALAVNWGFFAGGGMAARQPREAGREGAPRGMQTYTAAEGLAVMGELMRQGTSQAGVLPTNWREWREFHPAAAGSPLLASLMKAEAFSETLPVSPKLEELTRGTLLAAPSETRHNMLASHFVAQVARVMRLPVGKFDAEQPLNNLGIDSLMAVELKNRLELELGVVVPVVKFLQGATISELAALVLEQITAEGPSSAGSLPSDGANSGHGAFATITGAEADRLLARLDDLSDDDVDALLRQLTAEADDQSS